VSESDIFLLSIGVGTYPTPPGHFWQLVWWLGKLPSVKLLQKTLEINTQSMAQLHAVLFGQIRSIRINQTFSQPEMATDLLEYNLNKLNKLRQRGQESFAEFEAAISSLLP
jgi:predicted patatin/cPLA2 family phospholipase